MSVHRGGGSAPRGVPHPGGGAWSGGVLGPRGVPAPARGVWSRGSLVETPWTATAAGGTHPTGMHSCWYC